MSAAQQELFFNLLQKWLQPCSLFMTGCTRTARSKGFHQNDVDPRCFESQCLKWAKLCKQIGLTVKSCLWSRVAVNLHKLDSVLGTSSYLLIVSKLNCAHVCSRTRSRLCFYWRSNCNPATFSWHDARGQPDQKLPPERCGPTFLWGNASAVNSFGSTRTEIALLKASAV